MSLTVKDINAKYKDGKHHVYIYGNYAGVTCRPGKRIKEHKGLGRDVTGWRVIFSHTSRQLCEELEALLHDTGYKGRGIAKTRHSYL